MKAEKILILILLIFLTVGAVSAAEDNTTTDDLVAIQESGIDDNPLQSDLDDSLQRTDDANLSAGKGNFNDLNNIITNAEENSEILLTNDYAYDKKTDSNYDDGISIGKTLTINGQYHIIDGKDNTVFEIKGNNVMIRNIIFKYAGEDTGIYIKGENCTIVNCNFVNCSSEWGSIIYSSGSNSNLINCTFQDVSLKHYYGIGGAITSDGTNLNVFNCSFIRCSATTGGAIYSEGDNCQVNDCKFKDCADKYNNALHFMKPFTLVNSSFINGPWYAAEPGNISNVFVDGLEYDISIFNNIKENERIVLTRDYFIGSEILIDADNIIIDGGGNTLSGNQIFSIAGSNLTIINCTFKKCIDAVELESDFEILTIDNCNFIDCTNGFHGTPVELNGSLIINNCNFINCTNHNYGSCLKFNGTSNVVGCDFINCNGAIYSICKKSTFTDCNFTNSTNKDDKVSIYFNHEFSLINSSFTNGIWYARESGQITNVTIDGEKYDLDIFENLKENRIIDLTHDYSFISPVKINKNNIIINGNGKLLSGNKIFIIEGRNVTIKNCRFSSGGGVTRPNEYEDFNTVTIYGGYCNVFNCTFTSTQYDVSAIYSKGVNTSIVDCTFNKYINKPINNFADNCSIINCSLINCGFTMIDDGEHYDPTDGGGIFNEGNNCNIINCSFINCSNPDYIHMIESWGDNAKVWNCSFVNCYILGGEEVGSIFISLSGKNCKIQNCDFINCTPQYSSITGSNIKMYYNDGSYFSVRVYDNYDAAVGESVVFKLNGKKLKTVKTDKNGYAKVKITAPPGTYKISATALGVTVTKKLTVKHILNLKKVKIKKSSKELTLTATLKKGKTPMKNKKVTFKFNGKKYITKTNKKGVAKVIIEKSVLSKLKVGKTAEYSAAYMKDTVKRKAKVKK